MAIPRFSVRNPVTVNLLMWLIVASGIFFWFDLVREFFPNAEAEQIFVTIPYPGATPEEVEKAVARRVERELENVNDVEEISSRILEGVAVIQITLDEDADRDQVINDIRSEIDKAKPYLPDGAEDPEIREARPMVPVIGVVIFGDVDWTRLADGDEDKTYATTSWTCRRSRRSSSPDCGNGRSGRRCSPASSRSTASPSKRWGGRWPQRTWTFRGDSSRATGATSACGPWGRRSGLARSRT